MSRILSLVPTDPVLDYPICGKDLFTGSREIAADYEYMYPILESDNDDQTQYLILTDAEFEEFFLRPLESLDTFPPTPALNEYMAPIPTRDVVQVERGTIFNNDNSQDAIHSKNIEPATPKRKTPAVPKPLSHGDIGTCGVAEIEKRLRNMTLSAVLVAGKATAEHNDTSKRNTKTRAKSSSGRRTGGREESLPSQQSRRDGGCRRADSGGSGERVMRRGYRTDMALDAGEKPPTKRRRDDDIDEEGSTSRVGKRNRTH